MTGANAVYPGFPADVLFSFRFSFRFYSVTAQTLLWTTLALVFGPMAERLLNRPSRHPSNRPPHSPDRPSPHDAHATGAAVLEHIAALGPFFAFDTHGARSVPTAPWRPMSELVRNPEPLLDRATAVRTFLAAGSGRPPEAVELRVAAPVTHLGLVARLISPALAATLHDFRLSLPLANAHLQSSLGGAFPLSLPQDALTAIGPTSPPASSRTADDLLEGPIQELVRAVEPLSVFPPASCRAT
ncbi:hypothetical protein [Streptomyces sp. CT34]|uniref:hypothetical protein n=1 Tax=Streptomyces sp. CT34 TaxID=1553907 RepID=UPI000A6603D3|nr:hypothetical protein [Streptomyces sp. CT34]